MNMATLGGSKSMSMSLGSFAARRHERKREEGELGIDQVAQGIVDLALAGIPHRRGGTQAALDFLCT